MELNELIKELDKKLIVTGKEIIDGIMYIYCETERQITKCKYCGKESENVHSTYTRVISDLPIQNYKVKLIIKQILPRFFSYYCQCFAKVIVKTIANFARVCYNIYQITNLPPD